jgi:hypothetical protein
MDKKVNDGRRPRAAEGRERQLMVNDGRGSWEAEDGEHGKKILRAQVQEQQQKRRVEPKGAATSRRKTTATPEREWDESR